MTIAIRATDLVKSYSQGVRALDGVTLAVNSGEVLVVMGPSGSGKTISSSSLWIILQSE